MPDLSGDLAPAGAVSQFLAAAGVAAPAAPEMGRLISAVSGAIQSFLDRRLVLQSYERVFNGNGLSALFLPEYPIEDVTAVAVNDTAVRRAVGAVGAGYVFDDTAIHLRGAIFMRGVQNVSVSYRAGFEVMPPAIVQAVCVAVYEIAGADFSPMGSGVRVNATQFSAGDHSVSLGGVESGAGGAMGEGALLPLSARVTALIAPYRKVHPTARGR